MRRLVSLTITLALLGSAAVAEAKPRPYDPDKDRARHVRVDTAATTFALGLSLKIPWGEETRVGPGGGRKVAGVVESVRCKEKRRTWRCLVHASATATQRHDGEGVALPDLYVECRAVALVSRKHWRFPAELSGCPEVTGSIQDR